MSNLEQVLAATPHKTSTVRPPTSYHENYSDMQRSRDELISDILFWTPHMAVQKQDDQHEYTFSNYVRIQDVVQKTCLR